jgi:hypothetical protein
VTKQVVFVSLLVTSTIYRSVFISENNDFIKSVVLLFFNTRIIEMRALLLMEGLGRRKSGSACALFTFERSSGLKDSPRSSYCTLFSALAIHTVYITTRMLGVTKQVVFAGFFVIVVNGDVTFIYSAASK